MRNLIFGTVGSLLLSTGCVGLSDSQARSEVEGEDESADEGEDGETDRDDCKIEGEQIGREGAVLDLGPTSVTFHDWVSKPGEPGEYLGFSIMVSGPPHDHFIVKAGGEKYIGDGAGWTHPSGMTNSASAISNVDFCDSEPPPCEDPEGCDHGEDPPPPPPPDDGGDDGVIL